VKQKIVDYHRDERNDWVAELECGHFQHVRHNPPWINRPWVESQAGRDSMLGFELNCKKCAAGAPVDATLDSGKAARCDADGKRSRRDGMKVYGDLRSGNCYKIKLLAALLDIDHEWQHVDVMAGETHDKDFLAMNPNAKVPVVQLDDGRVLWESNAIIDYLATGTKYLPEDKFLRAQVLQWQFFEQYSHEPYIAVARFIAKYQGMPEERRAEYHAKQPGGHKALAVMEARLAAHAYLVGESLTVADISLYAYTHVADEGGFDLSTYPGILAWMARIQSEPRYVGMGC
jgi:glutathione S-transferase